jgi:hypothetical protein
VGPNVTVEGRVVALLPAGDEYRRLINAAEALFFLACQRASPGFVALNDSPPGEQLRLLEDSWCGPARITDLLLHAVRASGGEVRAASLKLRQLERLGSLELGHFTRATSRGTCFALYKCS